MQGDVTAETETIIYAIYETILSPESWNDVVRHIGEWLGADLGMMTSPSLAGSHAVGMFAYGLDLTPVLANYPKHAGRAEFTLRAIATGRTPGAFLLDELMPQGERAQNAFWRDMVAPLGITSGIFSVVRTPDEGSGRAVILNYYRRAQRPDFSPADVRKFENLLPHLRRALGIILDSPPRQTAPSDTINAYNMMSAPCFLLSMQGEIIVANDAARLELAANEGVGLHQKRLQLSDSSAQHELNAYIARICDGGAWSTKWHMGTELLAERPSGQTLILVMMPIARENHIAGLASPARCLVTILEERLPQPERKLCGRLRRLYGLTDAEIDVAIAIASGRSPAEIARCRGTSVPTVRVQVKAALSKTDNRRVAALSKLVRRLRV
jgi:DNA-binding CsgD family transcriptional regulator